MENKSIKKNTIYNIIKNVSAIIFPLITFPYVSRVLQVENIGKINFGLSIVSYFSLLASLGVNTYAIRECAAVRNDRNKLDRIASEIFSINMITTIFSYLVLFCFLLFYKKIYNNRILILLQSISIIFVTLGTDWINSAMEDFKYITIRTILFQVLSLGLMLIFVQKESDYYNYAIISVIASSGANITNILYRKKYCNIKFVFNNIDWKRHFLPIIFMFVMILAQTVFKNIDMTMLGIMKGDYDVGIYSTALKISNIIETLVTSILWVILPRMSLYFSNKEYDSINLLLSKVLCFTVTLGLPMVVGLILISKDFISIVFGIEYIESANVLIILLIGVFFTYIGGSILGNMLLLPAKREKYMMLCCVIIAVFNIITNYLLIPKYSACGAAFTTLLCTVLSGILAFMKIDSKIKFNNIFSIFIKPIIGAFSIIIVCFLCKMIPYQIPRVLFSIFFSMIVYFIIQYITKNFFIVQVIDMLISKTKSISDIFKEI